MGKLEGILDYLKTQDIHISGISVDGISFADKPEKSVVCCMLCRSVYYGADSPGRAKCGLIFLFFEAFL